MSFDSRAFRQTVGQFATGVTVVATDTGDSVTAMTANAFTSLSLVPPLVLFCVGKTSEMGTAIPSASGFSVSILRREQEDLSTYFARGWKAPTPPPFSWVSWEGGHRLEGCAAALGCALETIHEGGDHWIVCGRVLALYRSEQDGTPLLFFNGRYATLRT